MYYFCGTVKVAMFSPEVQSDFYWQLAIASQAPIHIRITGGDVKIRITSIFEGLDSVRK